MRCRRCEEEYKGPFCDFCYASADDQARDNEDVADECAHEWVFTGTAYGGDDSRYRGEGRCYCAKCGADDA